MGDLCQISDLAIDSYVTWGKAIITSVISLPDCKTKMVLLLHVYRSTYKHQQCKIFEGK